MFEGSDQAIYQLLATRRLISPTALTVAWADREGAGQSLAALVLQRRFLTPAELLAAVADSLSFHYPATVPAILSPELVARVPSHLAHTYGIMPIAEEGSVLALLVADPVIPSLLDELTLALGCAVCCWVSEPSLVRGLIAEHYPDIIIPEDHRSRHSSTPASSPVVTATTGGEMGPTGGTPSVVHFVDLVLTQAIRDHASDIHFEPFEQDFKIRYRIDGVLYEMSPPPSHLALPIISRLKILANLNITERRLPQDGRFNFHRGAQLVDFRVSTLPTQFGESVVLRILDQSAVGLELGQLGLPLLLLQEMSNLIRRPTGMLIVTGPTGSGKTTTLYSCLQALNTVAVKMLTVEDPIEYNIDGIMQVPVNLAAGLTFDRAMRTFLRHDPDIVMVGEIRDHATAHMALQASLTGHFVLSTLHTNDAPGALTRLVEMGIEPFLLASTLAGVLAQRLVRRICPACRTAFTPSAADLQQLMLNAAEWQGRPFYHGRGCAACHQTGYQGRLGIFEFMSLTEPLRDLIVQGAALGQLRQQAVAQGMITLRAAGVEAILAGQTSLAEVMRYT
jgi:type IV pilus assembly protein PilB